MSTKSSGLSLQRKRLALVLEMLGFVLCLLMFVKPYNFAYGACACAASVVGIAARGGTGAFRKWTGAVAIVIAATVLATYLYATYFR